MAVDPALTERIIGAAIEVHRNLGPGLFENTYEICLCREFDLRGMQHRCQVPLPLLYKGVRLDCGYKMDVVCEEQVVLELKAVEALKPIHEAQLLTYLRLSGYRLGLLINFHEVLLKNGIKRIVL
jgi:GxxExxY protein